MAHDVLGIGDFVRAELVECTPGQVQEEIPLVDGVEPKRFHNVCGGSVVRTKTDDNYCLHCRQQVVDSEIRLR